MSTGNEALSIIFEPQVNAAMGVALGLIRPLSAPFDAQARFRANVVDC